MSERYTMTESGWWKDNHNGVKFGPSTATTIMNEHATLTARIAELEAIVSVLPLTADGVLFPFVSRVWHPKHGEGRVRWGKIPGDGGGEFWTAEYPYYDEHYWPDKRWHARASECYSTRAAAEAARKDGR